MESLPITGSALVGALLLPTVGYFKKHWKAAREVPAVTFVVIGVLSYGVAVLYTYNLTGAWVFNGQVVSSAIATALAAIGFKVGHKTATKALKK